jgi:hypothetical protein
VPLALLRRRVGERPDELPLLRQLERGLGELRDAEVHDPHAVVARDQDVLRLEVAVDDARLVDPVEARGDLFGDPPEEGLRDRRELFEEPPEVPAGDVLHHEVVDVPVLAHVERADDVLALDRHAGAGLAREPFRRLG